VTFARTESFLSAREIRDIRGNEGQHKRQVFAGRAGKTKKTKTSESTSDATANKTAEFYVETFYSSRLRSSRCFSLSIFISLYLSFFHIEGNGYHCNRAGIPGAARRAAEFPNSCRKLQPRRNLAGCTRPATSQNSVSVFEISNVHLSNRCPTFDVLVSAAMAIADVSLSLFSQINEGRNENGAGRHDIPWIKRRSYFWKHNSSSRWH